MAKANEIGLREIIVGLREKGTGEAKLKFIGENLKGNELRHVKELAELKRPGENIPAVSELTIAKLCEVLSFPVASVLPEAPRILGSVDLYVPPETIPFEVTAPAPAAKVETAKPAEASKTDTKPGA